jgi:RHH-type rel operon transcriptional repressor/antitoxin RelB
VATIQIPDELATQIEQGAQRTGETNETFLREAVLSRLEEVEEIAIATERLNNPGDRLSLKQVKKDLGLDD